MADKSMRWMIESISFGWELQEWMPIRDISNIIVDYAVPDMRSDEFLDDERAKYVWEDYEKKRLELAGESGD